MSSNYPASLDSTGTTFPVRNPSSNTAGAHAADHVNLADAIIKIETELGTEPSGGYTTVKDRLAGTSRVGLYSARGAASSHVGGRFFATDQAAEYISDGSVWIRVSAAAGETVYYPGLTLPPGLIRKTGVDVSRTGIYTDLFEAITRKVSGSGNSGQPVLTVAAGVGEGLIAGMKVEGTGVPVGASILSFTATTITLSSNLTTSGARDIRIFPHGNGNGSTTFGIPDGKGRGSVGRDNMGGVLASDQLTSDVTRRVGGAIGKTGGEMTHQLAQGAMPPHYHGGTATGAQANVTSASYGDHTHTAREHTHDTGVSFSGSTGVNTGGVNNTVVTTPPAGTRAVDGHTHTYSMSNTFRSGGMISGYGVHGSGGLNSGGVVESRTVSIAQSDHTHPIPRAGSSSGTVDVSKGDAHENMHPHMVEDNCLRL